jgi:hypothetical protein
MQEALDSENEKVRSQAARYVLDKADAWTERASETRIEEIPPEEREGVMESLDVGPDTTREVRIVSADVANTLIEAD